jgi:hypothetical protein
MTRRVISTAGIIAVQCHIVAERRADDAMNRLMRNV